MSRDRSLSQLTVKLQQLAKADPTLGAVLSAVAECAAAATPLDAHAAAAKGPSVSRSILLDLAYEEYCGREEAGEAIDPEAFCDRFPAIRSSLRRQIDVHCLLHENPDLLNEISEAQWPEPPETFLGFTLVQELGSGAFARVFLATEPALGNRRVVVKVALEGGAEAQTLGRLDHPNVVPILTVREDTDSGLTAICMPYVSCANLCDVLDHVHAKGKPPVQAREILDAIRLKSKEMNLGEDGPPSSSPLRHGSYEEGVLFVAAKLAEGLAFIHSRGVLHRDLKPSNVLVAADGRPMLLDFNLSADARQDHGRLGGTLPYMSPEQLRVVGQEGDPDSIGPASDLFSLGVVLYQLLTGRHPFEPLPSSGDIRSVLVERHKAGPLPLQTILPGLDGRFARAIEGCLHFEPSLRPISAAALAVEFQRLLSVPQRFRRRLARHWKLTSAGATALALAGLVAWILVPAPEPVAVRHLRAAQASYRQGDFQAAIEHYSQVIEETPNSGEAYFGRGRAFIKKGRFPLAINDFEKAFELSGDAQAKACIAYCMSRVALHSDAIDFGRSALGLGFENAAVFNNIGYSQLQLSKLEDAHESLSKAISLDHRLQAAYHNRARVDRQWFMLKQGHFPKSGLEDIRKAIEIGPPATDLYVDAASLAACAAKTDQKWVEPALEYIRQAIELGQAPARFQKDLIFATLASDPRFSEIMKTRPSQRTPDRSPALVDPIVE